MPTSKVNENYQVTIPREVRQKAKIDRGDTVLIEYDEHENIVKVMPPKRGERKSWVLGRKLTLKEIEAGIERGQAVEKP
jgi:AbrB family looped-hinge helix DNA binding protein